MINETATKTSEWYVLPADQKWFTRYLVSKIILKTLKKMNPKYPEVSKEDKEELEGVQKRIIGSKVSSEIVITKPHRNCRIVRCGFI